MRERVDNGEAREVSEVWGPGGVGYALVIWTDVPGRGTEGWAVLEADAVFED